MDREVIGDFITNGKYMVVVLINGNAHVMEKEEWMSIWGRNHMDRWLNPRKNKNRRNKKSKMAV